MEDFEKSMEDYIEKGGVGCLFCGSDNIEGGFIEIDVGRALQKIGCNECSAEWQDVYKLVDVDNIQILQGHIVLKGEMPE